VSTGAVDTKAAHAKNRPPSAAARWVHCPGSTLAAQLYPNDESEASTKGDYAHGVLEACILFGVQEPVTEDEDLNENLALVIEWIAQTRATYGPECKVYAEHVYDIPETGEWGTCDVTFVSPSTLHIADYKNGYVVVDVARNEQLFTYLLGAIARYGTRDRYLVSVLQPNASHINGPIRTVGVTNAEVEQFRAEIAWSMANENIFAAGKHCKKTYCPHRGNCATFLQYATTEAADAWFPADVNAMTDDQLATALDHAEILQGLRDELRKAAMGRMLQMDRHVPGYKVVKGRQNREFRDEQLVGEVLRASFGATDDHLYAKAFVSVKAVEDYVKAWSRKHGFARGKWKAAWENHIAEHVLENVTGLTLERATDARPAHKRGGEFGTLVPGQMDEKVFTI
jgi:hypothetical protein